MAATVYFNEWNGTSGSQVATAKNGATIQFKREDSSSVEVEGSATAPLLKPNQGVFRSYEKYLRIWLQALGGSASISNIEVFCSGSAPSSGISIWCKASAAYATPKVGGYDAGGAMSGPKVDFFGLTADDPLTLGAGPYDTITASAGDFLVMQMEVLPSATIGTTQGFTLVHRYDEA